MKNKFTKSVSIMTAVLTAITSLSMPVVSYAEEDVAEDVIYQSSFSDYVADGRPNGWVAPKYVLQGADEVASPGSDATFVGEVDGNNAVRLTNSADSRYNDIIPFNKVISDGKLQISFDMKFDDYSGKWIMIQLFNTSMPGKYLGGQTMNNYKGTDVKDFRGHGYSLTCTSLMRMWFKSTDAVLISKDGRWAEGMNVVDKTVFPETWHHFDFVVDVDNSKQEVWIDGTKVTEEPFELKQNKGYSFKGLGFLHPKTDTTSMYDNICVTHYKSENSVKILTDHLETSGDSVRISLSFSEYLNRAPQDGDFVITDAYSGEELSYTVEDADGRAAVINVTSENPAKLNIAFKNQSDLRGVISSKIAKDSVSAYTNHKSGDTVIPVLDDVSGVDYSGKNVSFDGESVVPIGTTSVNVKFSTPINFENAENKIYIEKVEDSSKLSVNYDIAADKKSVKVNLEELMEAGEEYELVISNELISADDASVGLAKTYSFSFETSSDSGFGIFGEKITVESDTATFNASVIKSDENRYKGTLIICGYSNEEIDGVTYSKLEKVNIAKYDITDKSITSYEAAISGLENVDVIKCFINEVDTQKSLCVLEKEL